MSTPELPLNDALARYREQFLPSRNFAPLTRGAYIRDVADLIAFLMSLKAGPR